jgi:hypothetical protein
MRTILYAGVCSVAATAAVCVLLAAAARADVASERPGSILIFPKVTRDTVRDTVIQVTNTGNMPDTVQCSYLSGQSVRGGTPLCSETDFVLNLTKQQPTHWSVSTGRNVTSSGGISPGNVPPVPPGFSGALVCVEVDSTTATVPMPQNALKGEATFVRSGGGDLATYNAVAVQGAATGVNNGDNILDLNNIEYNACSSAAVLNFIPGGGNDPVIEAFGNNGVCGTSGVPCHTDPDCSAGSDPCGVNAAFCTCSTGQSQVQTTLTVLPCQLDFNTATPTSFKLSVSRYDETEAFLSGGASVSCWGNIPISTIAALESNLQPGGSVLTPYATALITSTVPFLAVAQSVHVDTAGNTTSTVTNLQTTGLCSSASPPQACHTTSDCGATGGTCQLTIPSTITLADHAVP